MFKKFIKKENVDLSQYSTMRCGGMARYMLFPKNEDELIEIFDICKKKEIKTFVLGNGSNVLFSDKGFDGAIIKLDCFDGFERDKSSVRVQAGKNLFVLGYDLQRAGLTGLEWCFGIPGTLGGLLCMNGGCFGHEICEFVSEVRVFDGEKIFDLKKEEIDFSYRSSTMKEKGYIILSAKLKLQHGDKMKIMQDMIANFDKKKKMQPYDYPSLGSVFKIVTRGDEKIFPAKEIDDLGLKGFKVGGAEVSKKHAGFVVNSMLATSQEVFDLIKFLEEKLKEKDIDVTSEIVFCGEFD